jgi:Ty3 transposon capsid-like protein
MEPVEFLRKKSSGSPIEFLERVELAQPRIGRSRRPRTRRAHCSSPSKTTNQSIDRQVDCWTMPPKQVAANLSTPNNDDLRQQLATLMERLDIMQEEINTLRSQIRTQTPVSVEVIKEPTVSKPEPFSGTEDVSIFLQQCELCFDLQPSRFPTDYNKVGFILSYLRGPAAHWARPYLSNKTHELRHDLPKFIDAIEQAYGDPTRRFRATIELRALKQTSTVARYSSEFQAIASNLSWNDEALCSQFYEGLVDGIKKELAKNPPATLREFMTAAIRLANGPVEPAENNPPILAMEPPRPSPFPYRSKLDAAERARCQADGRCYRCRQLGHKVPECPLGLKDDNESSAQVPATFMMGGAPSYPQVGWRSSSSPLVELVYNREGGSVTR